MRRWAYKRPMFSQICKECYFDGCPIRGSGKCGPDVSLAGQIPIQPLGEDMLLKQFRAGGGDWGEHGEGEGSNVDGRKSRYPTLRKSRFNQILAVTVATIQREQ